MSVPFTLATPEPRVTLKPVRAPSLWTELLALICLALFLPVNRDAIQGRDTTLALLGASWLVLWIALDPLLHARDLVFSWLAVPYVALISIAVLAIAFVAARLTRPRIAFRRALLLTLGTVPLAMVGEIASWKLTQNLQLALIAVLSVYALAYFVRGLRLLTGRQQPLAVAAAVVTCAMLLLVFEALQTNPRFWVRPDEKLDRLSTSGAEWARMQRVLFQQQARIDADIAKLAPQRPGVQDMYFVGFAGFGREAIFAREIGLAHEVVDDRFDTANRSLRLVNDQRDLDSWPIATEPGLRHALLRLGQAMGNEDVLFLTLASHGDRDQGVRISSPGLVSGAITPAALDQMLREAGIEWHVIVVSACYSGGFTKTLATERSIVITAAAPDRKSFGCNDSRELTYFGEAFFKDALRGDRTLRTAFSEASVALDRMEREGGIVPSLPQAHFGGQIEAKLADRTN